MKLVFLALLLGSNALFCADKLKIFFVDVEGGQATLIVTPKGESILVDTGWAGFESRDAKRIAAAGALAGVKKIDWLVITHFHADHVGGIKQLSEQMPIGHVVDHGPTIETSPASVAFYKGYEEIAAKSKRVTVKPGDKLPVKGAAVEILAANGEVSKRNGSPNPICGKDQPAAVDPTENARSVGFLLTFGKFKFIDLGDLTWNKELDLMCPTNRVGTVDVYLTTHHGADSSGPASIVHALAPKVAIMNNGETKGGTPPAWKIIKASPGLQDLWQVHFSAAGGATANTDEKLIANMPKDDKGNYIALEAESNGKFTVSNSRNGYKKSY